MTTESAAMSMLRSLGSYGVEYLFGNFGTDHPTFLEAAAALRQEDTAAIPTFVTCPHETLALSAAHGYAVSTNKPQAVLVHVDVGTQNLGAMVHNAHRGDAPVYIIAGLAPITNDGHPASRNSVVHYLQDVYDQPGIVREYCRWTAEYQTPADPDEFIARGLALATTPPAGPVYLTATREALEDPVEASIGKRQARGPSPIVPDAATIEQLVSLVREAERPLVITSKLGNHNPVESVASLQRFVECTGAGVVETYPASLNFPRTHEQHVGYDAASAAELADLIILADVDVPWVPRDVSISNDTTILHLDATPAKETYPQWDFPIDLALPVDAAQTLDRVVDHLNKTNSGDGAWADYAASVRSTWEEELTAQQKAERLTPSVLSAALGEVITDTTILVNEATTSNLSVLCHTGLDRPGSYFYSHGSGLGWAPGAAVGVKFAHPDSTVISLVGDGSYTFANPTATAWVQAAYEQPTLTIIYNNSGWNAVRSSALKVHPDGDAASEDIPESKFTPRMELSHAANVVDAHTETVTAATSLEVALSDALNAVDNGTPAVLDVHLEAI